MKSETTLFRELLTQDKSLREIAKAMNITYYRAQQLYTQQKGRYMLSPITLRTIPLPYGHKGEANLRMLPYQMAADAQSEEEARDEMIKGLVPAMSIELQIQPNYWLNFDFDALYASTREDQLKMFNNDEQINLSCFSQAVSFCLSQVLFEYNYELLMAVLKDGFKRQGREDGIRNDARFLVAMNEGCGNNPLLGRFITEFEDWVKEEKKDGDLEATHG